MHRLNRPAVTWAASDPNRPLTVLTIVGAAAVPLVRAVGLPPWDVHGPLHRLGVMDPLCGITRASVALAHGDVALAWTYNPASLALAAFAVMLLVRLGYGLRSRWPVVHARPGRAAVAIALIAVAALWINQQHHAALLEQGPCRSASRLHVTAHGCPG